VIGISSLTALVDQNPLGFEATRVGDASATEAAGMIAVVVVAVAVAPTLMLDGLIDIAGTTGEVYCVPVAESPEPPATTLSVLGFSTHSAMAATIAAPPTTLATVLTRVRCI
jgi:hypothetical protein